MKLDINDPKWTAYAFGELDAAECAAIEVELRLNPAGRQYVAELQRTGALLKGALAGEPALRLTPEQRGKLAAAVSDCAAPRATVESPAVAVAPALPRHRLRRRWVAVLGAVAASMVVAALVLPAVQSARESDRRVANTTTTTTTESDRSSGIDSLDAQPRPNENADGPQVASASTANAVPAKVGDEFAEAGGYGHSVANRGYGATGYGNAPTIPLGEPAPSYGGSTGGYAYGGARPTRPDTSGYGSGGYGEKPGDITAAPRISSASLSSELPPDGGHSAGGRQLPTKGNAHGANQSQPIAANFRQGYGAGRQPADLRKIRSDINGSVTFADRETSTAPASAMRIATREKQERLLQLRSELAARTEVVIVGDFAAAEVRRPVRGKEAEVAELEREIRDLESLNTDPSNEVYDLPPENQFEAVASNPLSTFSIDVDTASYANVRRFLVQNSQLPPPSAVRIEEMINYFRYNYPQPDGDVPFSVTTEVATCPWNTDHRLVRVGLKGKEIAREKRPVSNLVFLLDVSGSMQPANKLPLVRESMKLLVRELSENDRVAIVVYAGASGMVLDSTTGDQKDLIIDALDRLQAGGSTNGAGGLQQAYDVAMQHFIKGGTNRVILATDGDFNVGITDRGELIKLIEEKAKSGVFLTTLGFGMGNLKDATLEQLADKGNGNYAYVDTLAEGRKVLVEEMSGTLVTIAKDVKVQIEFNPAEVASYRLIGYENRRLAAEDFNDDKKDAGEIGAGHTVTALYELVPAKAAAQEDSSTQTAVQSGVDPLRYQKPAAAKLDLTEAANTGEMFTLKLRYKQPDGDTSKLIERPVKDSGKAYRDASGDFKFAASVAAFGMTLRHSQHRGTITLDGIKELALEGRSFDPGGYRSEFFTLIEKAQALGAK